MNEVKLKVKVQVEKNVEQQDVPNVENDNEQEVPV